MANRKNNNNNNNKKKRQAPSRRSGGRAQANPYGTFGKPSRTLTGGITASQRLSAQQSVCGLVDPFCKHATGSLWPDESASPVVAWSDSVRVPVTTNADGYAAGSIFFGSDELHTNHVIVGGLYSTSSIPTSGTLHTQEWVGEVRVVCAGARFFTTMAPSAAAGLIDLRIDTGSDLAAAGIDFSSVQNIDSHHFESHALAGADLHVVAKPGQDAREFRTPLSAENYDSWSHLLYTVSSTASTVVGYWEIIVHFEVIPKTGNPEVRLARPAAKHNPSVLRGVSKAIENIPPVIAQPPVAASKTIFDHIGDAVNSIGGWGTLASMALTLL